MHDPSEIRNLPIDIAFGRLQEWLVDRKRVPQDWRKRLAGIRARIAAAFPALPRDLHPSLLGLEPEGNRIYSPRPAAGLQRSDSANSIHRALPKLRYFSLILWFLCVWSVTVCLCFVSWFRNRVS